MSGFREPIVVILLLIAFFTAISGRSVDGVLLLVVAVSLAWDSARTRRADPQARDPAPDSTRIMRTRTGRVGVLVAWAWVGAHFFAR